MNYIACDIQLDPGATMPRRATEGSVGYDVTCLEFYIVMPDGEKLRVLSKDDLEAILAEDMNINYIELHTGVHISPQEGYYADIVPNSRMGKMSVIYGNTPGIIDPDYTGGIRVILNNTNCWFISEMEKLLPGNVIGQLIFRPVIRAHFREVKQLKATARGDGGFGSTERSRV